MFHKIMVWVWITIGIWDFTWFAVDMVANKFSGAIFMLLLGGVAVYMAKYNFNKIDEGNTNV